MEEIKRRTTILNDALRVFQTQVLVSVPNCELACLQLRKMYELIAFATLSANRERYARIRQSYEKDWDIAWITKLIENVNPRFLPIPITEEETGDPNIRFNIVEKPAPRLDRRELVRRHGILSDMLHAQNPYRPSPDYKKWFERVVIWRDELVALLNVHRAIIDDRTFYRVAMQTDETGDVQVAVMELFKEAAK